MEDWLSIAEKFGISVVMLIGISWGMVKLFQFQANTLMKQIAENHSRIEEIIIKLIDNSGKEREQNKLYFEKMVTILDASYNMMVRFYKNSNGQK